MHGASAIETRVDLWRAVAIWTLIAVVISLAITGTMMTLLWGTDFSRTAPISQAWLNGFVMAVLAPLCAAPPICWRLLTTMRELNRARIALREMADTDHLTGLRNRRGFRNSAGGLLLEATSHAQPVAVLLCDIDHFKSVNDRFGHDVGDQAIRHVANQLDRVAASENALSCRHGGEEFAMLLVGLPIRKVQKLAEALRAACDMHPLSHNGADIRLTVSIGMAMASHADADLDELLARADEALYAAKAAGRNQVVSAAA